MKKLIAILLICCSCASTKNLSEKDRLNKQFCNRHATGTNQFKWWSVSLIVVIATTLEVKRDDKRKP